MNIIERVESLVDSKILSMRNRKHTAIKLIGFIVVVGVMSFMLGYCSVASAEAISLKSDGCWLGVNGK